MREALLHFGDISSALGLMFAAFGARGAGSAPTEYGTANQA